MYQTYKTAAEPRYADPRRCRSRVVDGLTVSCYFSPMLETLAVPHDEMCRAAEKFLCGSSCGFIEFSPEIRSGETLSSIGIPAEK